MPTKTITPRICEQCGRTFQALVSRRTRFCGRICANTSRAIMRETCTCHNCGKIFQVHPNVIKKGGGRYCSHRCRGRGKCKPAAERFWPKVHRGDGCWEWIGGYNPTGYGSFWYNGRSIQASRMAYLLTHGTIPDGMLVCHHCDTPSCVRPDHLFLGTPAENQHDAGRKGRRMKRLTLAQRVEIRGRHAAGGISQTALAREYGVCRTSIHQVLKASW